MKHRTALQVCMTALIVIGSRSEAFAQADFWQKVPGLNGDTLHGLAINTGGTLFVGKRGGGVARSTDHGVTWGVSSPGLTFEAYRFGFDSSGKVFALGFTGLYRSTDDGSSWTQTGDPGISLKTLAINDSGHIFVGWGHETGGTVERSTDNGTSWVNTGLNTNSYALAISASGTLFSGGIINGSGRTGPACVFRSTDNGSTWTNTGFFTLPDAVTCLAISPAGHIFAGTSSFGVFHSSDDGAHWVGSRFGSRTSVTCLAVNASGAIFAGTANEGVLRSTDDGETWTAVNSGLTNLNVSALAVNASGTIFAGTWGGLFRSVQSTTSVTDLSLNPPISFSLDQNYPNPFNPTTSVKYTVGGTRGQGSGLSVKLAVFDLLGREVAVLVNEKKAPGTYEVKFDGSGLASGMYVYRLRAGSFVQARTMLLLK